MATEPPYLRLYQLEDDELVFIEVSDNDKTISYGIMNDGRWYILDATEVPVLTEKWGDTPSMLSGPRVDEILAETIEDPAEYGLDPPLTTVRLGRRFGADLEFQMGNPTPDGDYRYVRLLGDSKLFAMPASRAKHISDLAAAPPYGPSEQATPEPG